jgi:hypothetical protein
VDGSDDFLAPLPKDVPGTPEYHHEQDYMQGIQRQQEQLRQGGGFPARESGYPPSGGYRSRAIGPKRPLLSKALLITVPLGVLLYFFPKNGKHVQIPGEVHFFFAVVVAWLGSPRLRPIAIGIVILVVLFVAVVTLWTNHVIFHH